MKFNAFLFSEIPQTLRSLLLFPLRSFLSTLGILFGVVSVVTMLSIGEGAKQEMIEQIERLGMNNIIVRQINMSEEQKAQVFEKKSKGLTLQDVESVKKNLPILVREAPLKIIEATLTSSSLEFSPEILVVSRSFGEMKALKLIEGRFLCDLDQKNRSLVCVLGNEVAKGLGNKGHLGNILKLNQVPFEIVGVLKSSQWKENKNQAIAMRNMEKAILIPFGSEISLTNRFLDTKDHLSEVTFQVQNSQEIKTAVKLVKNVLNHSRGGYEDYQLIIPQELLRQAQQTQFTFNWVLGSIACISLLVGGIGIMNIMLANVSARTREIGIRRALGANQQHILIHFLFESLLLTIIGGFLGVLVGTGLSLLISWFAGWRMIVTIWSVLLSLTMSLVVGLCSGLYPAYIAAKLDPIQAIRHD